MVVNRNRQYLFRPLLTDDIFVENRLDILGLRQLVVTDLVRILEFLTDDVIAEFDALVANEDGRARNQLANFVLALAAKRTIEEFAVLVLTAGVIAHAGYASSNKNQSLTTVCVYNTGTLSVQSAMSHICTNQS